MPAADFTQQPAAFREECARLHQQALAAINAAWESRWGAVERAIDAAREEQRKADAGDEDALTTEVAASNIEAAETTEYVEAKREKDAIEAYEPDSYCVPFRMHFSDDVRKLTQTTANALNEAGAVQAGAGYYMFVERAESVKIAAGLIFGRQRVPQCLIFIRALEQVELELNGDPGDEAFLLKLVDHLRQHLSWVR